VDAQAAREGRTMTHNDKADWMVLLNRRWWLEHAVTRAGAEITGSGVGLGQADIDVIVDGQCYNISIRPVEMVKA
jgi:hypothetical protein